MPASPRPWPTERTQSKLLKALDSEAHRQRVQLTADERLRLTMWMDANAPYHDRFVNKRANQKAYDIATDKELSRQITAVHERRCGACHKPAEVTRLDWIDLRQPERTLFLRAPLSKSAGGTQSLPGHGLQGRHRPGLPVTARTGRRRRQEGLGIPPPRSPGADG